MKLTNEQIDELFRAIDYKEIIRNNATLNQCDFIESALKIGDNCIDVAYYFCQHDEPMKLINCSIELNGWDSGGNEIELEYDKDYFKAQETKLWIDIEKWLSE